MAEGSSLLPLSVQKNLLDKLYEKRKSAALEVEGMVKQYISSGNHGKVIALIDFLIDEYALSPQASHRKGGLIGLAAATVGLASEASPYLGKILPAVINSFSDQDSRVRFYACEALYNIAKVARQDMIIFFNLIFDSLCKISADTDPNVQSAAHLLDRLIKDIVTESNEFSVEEFIPLLRQRMNVLNTYVRQFLLGWITVLDNVPDIDMLGFLPDFLDGLFNMLSDNSCETRQTAHAALAEFLKEIKNSKSVDHRRIFEILVRSAASPDAFTRLISITWMNELVKGLNHQLSPFYADILGSVLTSISDKEENIRGLARETNEELRSIEVLLEEGFDVRAVVEVPRRELLSHWEPTRIEALRWILLLLHKHRMEMMPFVDSVLNSLLHVFADPSDEVVSLALEVHACIAKEVYHFHHCIVILLQQLRKNRQILESRGSFIIRKLCDLLNAEHVYREFSTSLEKEDDLDFARFMVEVLNLLLFTAPELKELRSLLKESLTSFSGKVLFEALYPSWCHSPIATISLCLLAQAFEHASMVIQTIDEQDVDTKFLLELEKLVRLLEAPIFANLRIQLLEPGHHAWLVKALYGLLLLLPQQSAAFTILKRRLKPHGSSFSNFQISALQNKEIAIQNNINGIDFSVKLHQFWEVQKQHRSSQAYQT